MSPKNNQPIPPVEQVVKLWPEPWRSEQIAYARELNAAVPWNDERDPYTAPLRVRIAVLMRSVIPIVLSIALILGLIQLGKVSRCVDSMTNRVMNPECFEDELQPTSDPVLQQQDWPTPNELNQVILSPTPEPTFSAPIEAATATPIPPLLVR